MRLRASAQAGMAAVIVVLAACSGDGGGSNEASSLSLAERCEARRKEASGGRIVNGEPAKPGSAPWQAQIFSPPRHTEADRAFDSTLPDGDECKVYLEQRQPYELQHQCGGSYIGEGWVITAAHCLVEVRGFDKPGDMVAGPSGEMVESPLNAIRYRSVRLGTQNLTAGGAVFAIDSIVLHGDYTKKAKLHDIALIKLKQTPELARLEQEGRLAAVALMPAADPGFDPDEQFRVTGWGWMGHREAEAATTRLDSRDQVQRNPPELQQLSLKHLPDEVCAREYGALFGPGALCVGALDGAAEQGTCQGDSGGPLTRERDGRRELVGLVSHGKGCAAGKPIVFTRVSYYGPWIASARKAARPGEVVRHGGDGGG